MTHETIEKTGFDVKRLVGLHTVTAKLASGEKVAYHYAWRGGPKLEGSTPEEIEAAYHREKARYVPEWKAPRPQRKKLEPTREKILRRACQVACDNARSRATKRGIDFKLDKEGLARLAEGQRWLCAVSGLPFAFDFDREGNHSYNPYGMSVDRLDCSKGYTPRNVRLVLTAVNFGLNDWGDEIYLRIARAVVARDLANMSGASPLPVYGERRWTQDCLV